MGIYDRDYYRGDSRSPRMMTGIAPVCKGLIIANVVVFVLQLVTIQRDFNVSELLLLDPFAIFEHWQVWRLLTYAFCHDPSGIWHILFNMLFLWWFGSTLESMYGSREFLRFYLKAAILAALCYIGLGLVIDQLNPMLGASGAVMAVLMLYALYFPRQKILLFFILPLEIRWLVLGYVIFDLFPVLQSLGGAVPMGNVAHAAHLGGLLYGFLYKRFDLRSGQLLSRLRMRKPSRILSPRRRVRIYKEPEPDDLEKRVDEILAKISSQGEASLTDEERRTLVDAGRRYQRRGH